jgi:hypothetical protein
MFSSSAPPSSNFLPFSLSPEGTVVGILLGVHGVFDVEDVKGVERDKLVDDEFCLDIPLAAPITPAEGAADEDKFEADGLTLWNASYATVSIARSFKFSSLLRHCCSSSSAAALSRAPLPESRGKCG